MGFSETFASYFATAVLAWSAGTTDARAETTVRESRPIAGVERVVLRGVGDLIVKQGERESLVIEAEPRILPKLRSRVAGGTLTLDIEGSVSTRQALRYHLTVRRLSAIRSDGSGDVRLAGLRAEALSLALQGSGSLHAAGLALNEVELTIAGSGDVTLSGEASAQRIAIEGSGSCDAASLQTRRSSVRIAGSGDASVRARETLEVDISGSGDLTYYGNPRVTRRIEGSGSVVKG